MFGLISPTLRHIGLGHWARDIVSTKMGSFNVSPCISFYISLVMSFHRSHINHFFFSVHFSHIVRWPGVAGQNKLEYDNLRRNWRKHYTCPPSLTQTRSITPHPHQHNNATTHPSTIKRPQPWWIARKHWLNHSHGHRLFKCWGRSGEETPRIREKHREFSAVITTKNVNATR